MSEKPDTYLPLFGRDFITATMGWSDAAVGAYIRLLIVQWEQGGLPEDLDELAAIAPTVRDNWRRLEPKFPVWEDGQRRNRRLEEHRAKSIELHEARSAAGRAGNQKRWGDRKAIANGIAKGIANRSPPSPSPSPDTSSLRSEEENSSLRSEFAPTETPAARRSRSRPADSIRWTPAGGWEGIEDTDRQAWRVAYPACDIARELAAAGEWLRSNPEKARKSRWRAFVTRWLSRSQDRGGGLPSSRPGRPDAPLTLDEKLARDRREAARKPAWRAAPAGCPDDLAHRLFNAMLPADQYRENLETYRKEMAARASCLPQDGRSGPGTAGDTMSPAIGPQSESYAF